ncbi:MAG: hypothetical protein ACI828_002560 [Flavobacteriales bacterium]|jgi:hypothetical protein
MTIKYIIASGFLIFLCCGCATYGPKFLSDDGLSEPATEQQQIAKTFYLIGDAGGATPNGSTDALIALKKLIDSESSKGDYALFLGDNIYEKGLPKKGNKDREDAEHKLQAQLDAVKDFKGNVVFLPGNHDWYSGGLQGVKRQEEYIEKALKDKNAFQPENGCPIEKIDISEDIIMLVIDTQWYLSNWDKHPTMNDECEIKTREDFFLEIEGELKKNNEKTIIMAMHHPMFTNGTHGGYISPEKHLFPFQNKVPLPVIASVIAQLRLQGGVSIQDRYSKRYNELMKRLETLTVDTKKAIVVSGHEHSLQYIDHDGIKQVVSGAGAKASAAKLADDGLFSYGGQGFAVLEVLKDGSSQIRFFSAKNGEPAELFRSQIHGADQTLDTSGLETAFESEKEATIYPLEDIDKSAAYKRFWGDHYREVYGTPIKVPVVTLDTLMGGFRVDRKGGGHQTRSLRLVTKEGQNYALRAVKKSAVQFLQSVVFKDNFVQDEFRDTFTEDVILDFYTSSHPYASIAVGKLSDAIDVYHTNPTVVWMPKHPALGNYNSTYGDELYILEERPDDGFLDVPSFGNPDAIESTSDLLKNLRKDEKYRVDEASFIRARLFDMLLGDWDRHTDQWRWSRFDKSEDEVVYKPIPRDRDQAFSKYDGGFLGLIKALIPPARQFQTYSGELKDVKWINSAGIKLDRALLPNATEADWIREANYIIENLTDASIDAAFDAFPEETKNAQLSLVKTQLKARRQTLADIAQRYFRHLNSVVILRGTDKDDHFEITREAEGTRVQISRIKGGEIQTPYVDRLMRKDVTKELWIYGLDDDDHFRVSGNGKKPIFTRIIGGQNNDIYTVDDGRNIKIYEHKTKPNTIAKRGGALIKKSSIYNHNTYDFNKGIVKVNSILPSIGSNPDDGFFIGLQDTYTIKGFNSMPFHRKHVVKAGYYFATSGFDISYKGIFSNALGKWDLVIGGSATNESYARNFFGLSNESVNNDDVLGLDYNRVRNGNYAFELGAQHNNNYGSILHIKTQVEFVELQDDANRFITNDFTAPLPDYFEGQTFAGIEGGYAYTNADNPANPSRGMDFKLTVGSKMNLEDTDRIYGYISPSLGFYNSLSRNNKLVLKTLFQGQVNVGDSFEFYQGASIGGRNGLRGYRNERFTGESSFVASGDIRYSFNRMKTGLLPIQLGIYGGGDVGRVWNDGEDSDIWHSDVGGGFWINAVDMISGQFGLFSGDDGLRFAFGFGVKL